ncbi:hypothetical protein FCV25MIE_13699 [Fagus crenata]
METVPSTYYGNLKRYWRRRRYQRLNGANNNKRKLKITRLGGTARRLWRVRRTPKLTLIKVVSLSPIKLLAKFHDAYVKMMIRLVSNVKNPKDDRRISVVSSGEEVDGRFVLEIYKRIASTHEIPAF